MRTIGKLTTEQTATRFSDFLFVQGIENQVEDEEDGTFSLWVLEEDQMLKAAELLKQFQANPNNAAFKDATGQASAQRSQEAKEDSSRRSTVMDSARVGYERHFTGTAMLTWAIIAICVAVGLYSQLGANDKSVRSLFISEYHNDAESGMSINRFTKEITETHGFLPEVRSGQVWRLLTPIFLHFGMLHIAFNMMMFWQLGNLIENRFSARYLLALILAIGILSNLGQVLWTAPNFGGMSGVDYGLFGFLWIRGRFDRYAGWQLNQSTVTQFLVWLVLCYTGMLGPIANAAHTVGLLVGMAWGYLSARR